MYPDQIKIGDVLWFAAGVEQGKDGIEVDLKAHPKIEEFFVRLSEGTAQDLTQIQGKSWFDPKNEGLKVYKIPNAQSADTEGYNFYYPGFGFNLAEEIGGPFMNNEASNLSCLRIVGISKGVRLGVKGIMSLNAQRSLVKSLTQNVRKFVRGHINTARVEFKLTGREVGVSYTKEW